MTILKTCKFCNTSSTDLTVFVKNRQHKDGFLNICKECRNTSRRTTQLPEELPYLRKCTDCGLEAKVDADLGAFAAGTGNFHGKANICKPCYNTKIAAKRIRKMVENPFHNQDRNLAKRGITYKDKVAMVEAVNFKCEICDSQLQSVFHAQLDHSHTNGHNRGILCSKCNTGLGKFNDNIDMLNKAMQYLLKTEHKIDGTPYDIKTINDSLYGEWRDGLLG
jgi:DNA-directed RNA polymerase subunit M/transcription elongation factor TFIIS